MIYCKYPSSSLTIYSHFYRKLNLFIKFPSCTYPCCYIIVYPKMKKITIKYYCCSKYFKRYPYQKNKNKTFLELSWVWALISIPNLWYRKRVIFYCNTYQCRQSNQTFQPDCQHETLDIPIRPLFVDLIELRLY